MAGQLIGEVCAPSELFLPARDGTYIGKTGEIWLSGNKLWFTADGTTPELVASA